MSSSGTYLLDGYRLYIGDKIIEDESFYDNEGSTALSAKEIANMYKPILYRQTGFYDPSPEALYYRVVTNENVICIQYFGYWAVQFFKAVLRHVYDYEPILVYFKKIGELPFQVVFSGGDFIRGLHWIEAHTSNDNLDMEKPIKRIKSEIPPRCIYPFSFRGKREITENVRIFQITKTLLPNDSNIGKFDGTRVKLAIAEDHHVYSINIKKRIPLKNIPLRELSDEVLTTWYRRYFEKIAVEPFQHDVSNPMVPPFIRYKRKVILSKIESEIKIIEKKENQLKLHLKIFESYKKTRQPITRLMNQNFKIRIDDKPFAFLLKEEDEIGNYNCIINISKLSIGEHRLNIDISDNLGNTSDPIQLDI